MVFSSVQLLRITSARCQYRLSQLPGLPELRHLRSAW